MMMHHMLKGNSSSNLKSQFRTKELKKQSKKSLNRDKSPPKHMISLQLQLLTRKHQNYIRISKTTKTTISTPKMIQTTISKRKKNSKLMKQHRLCLTAAGRTLLLPSSKLWPQSSVASRIRLIRWRSSIVVTMMTRRRIRCLATMLLLIRTPLYLETTLAKPTLSATPRSITIRLAAVLSSQWQLLIIGMTWYQRVTHTTSSTTTPRRMYQRNKSQPAAVVSYLQVCLIEGRKGYKIMEK